MDNYAANNSTAGQAAQADYHTMREIAAQQQKAAGSLVGQSIAAQKSQPLNARLQEANKRAIDVADMLETLTSAMLPQPPAMNNALAGQAALKDSTVSGGVDDLIQTLGRILANVSRLSVAITGAA